MDRKVGRLDSCLYQFKMKKIDAQTGNPERTLDMKLIMKSAEIPTFNKQVGKHLLERLSQFTDYMSLVKSLELFLYNRVMLTGPATEVLAQDDNKNNHFGVNYASADYLGLAQHQDARKAAISAIQKYGVSAGNTPSGLGSHELYIQLQRELEEYWDTNILIFSTGWMAGFGVIKALIRPCDHVIMDYVSHNCLQQGAISATKNIKKFQHLDQDEMVQMLKETREKDPHNAILVVTQGLFSMDADSPDLVFYQKMTKQYNAYLLIDCAHDFGHLGQKGKGAWEVQGLSDFSNVILSGTGSKTLSTNIGFVGVKDKKILQIIRYMAGSFNNATVINPVQAATSLAQLNILRNKQGADRRKKVVENYNYLRNRLEQKGHKVIGNPCAIMPVFIGNQIISRLVSRLMMDKGVHVNGIEYPVVKIGQARLRVCLLPQHTKAHMDRFVQVFEQSLVRANQVLEKSMAEYSQEMSKQQTAKL